MRYERERNRQRGRTQEGCSACIGTAGAWVWDMDMVDVGSGWR